jgi:hypothetical protein
MTTAEQTPITDELRTEERETGQEYHAPQVIAGPGPVGEQEDIGSALAVEAERPELASTAFRFDYTVVHDEIAEKMRSAAYRVHSLTRAAVVEVGRELIAVKDGHIEHGHFTEWVERECGMSIRTAQRAMAAAGIALKNDKLSYLPADGLLALAGRLVPEPIVTEIIGRIDAGELPTTSEIKATIAAAKEEARCAAKEAKLTPRQRKARERQRATGAVRKAAIQPALAERQAKAKADADTAATMLATALGHRLGEFVALLDRADILMMIAALQATVREMKAANVEAPASPAPEPAQPEDANETDGELEPPLPFEPPVSMSPSAPSPAL